MNSVIAWLEGREHKENNRREPGNVHRAKYKHFSTSDLARLEVAKHLVRCLVACSTSGEQQTVLAVLCQYHEINTETGKHGRS